MNLRRTLLYCLLGLTLTPVCHSAGVLASQYHNFWLWGGVRPPAWLSQANTVYVLQGEISADHGPATRITPQGVRLVRGLKPRLWLVYRVNTLDWGPQILPALTLQLQRWRLADNQVVGLQLDFDAASKRLNDYAEFLRRVRQALPADYRLSVTGLLDWTRHGQVEVLNQMQATLDEIVIQTYQGRTSVVGYQRYLQGLARLKLPFRVGLVENGSWQAPAALKQNPWFKGYVVFLLSAPCTAQQR